MSHNRQGELSPHTVSVVTVDDSPIIQARLMTMIQEIEGVSIVGQTDNTNEVIQIIESLQPSVVILDIHFPKGSGIDVLRRAKKFPKSPLVIMLTNYPLPQYQQFCLDAKADYFFDKSSEFEKVIGVLVQLANSAGSPSTINAGK